MGYAGYKSERSYMQEPRHDPETNGKKRVCALCGRRFLPFQREDTMTNGGKSFIVHRGCKHKFFERKLPKKD